jgi:hypothetical protein
MKPLDCAATERRLHAYHDRELPVADQIAVAAHLEWCGECAARSADLRFMRNALQALAPGRGGLSNEEAASFGAAVVGRLKAEHDASFFARVRLMFDDMHLVYAGVGAAVATMVCLVVVLGMMRFATIERPDSLFGIMNVISMPIECDSVIVIADEGSGEIGCRERLAERFQRANESAEQDAVFTLDSLVIHQGRLASLDVLKSRGRTSEQAAIIEELLDAACRARVDQPGTSSGNIVRLVARETVRASKPQAIDFQLPVGKKRADAGVLPQPPQPQV